MIPWPYLSTSHAYVKAVPPSPPLSLPRPHLLSSSPATRGAGWGEKAVDGLLAASQPATPTPTPAAAPAAPTALAACARGRHLRTTYHSSCRHSSSSIGSSGSSTSTGSTSTSSLDGWVGCGTRACLAGLLGSTPAATAPAAAAAWTAGSSTATATSSLDGWVGCGTRACLAGLLGSTPAATAPTAAAPTPATAAACTGRARPLCTTAATTSAGAAPAPAPAAAAAWAAATGRAGPTRTAAATTSAGATAAEVPVPRRVKLVAAFSAAARLGEDESAGVIVLGPSPALGDGGRDGRRLRRHSARHGPLDGRGRACAEDGVGRNRRMG